MKRIRMWTAVSIVIGIALSGCEKNEEVAADDGAAVVVRSAPARQGGSGSSGSIREQLFAAAAEQLDVTVEALTEAIGSPPDLEAAAKKLGISIEQLRDVVPQPGQGGFGGRGQAFARAAEALNVAVEELAEALGSPPDFEAAAKKLEIPIEKLREALPFSAGGFGRQAQ